MISARRLEPQRCILLVTPVSTKLPTLVFLEGRRALHIRNFSCNSKPSVDPIRDSACGIAIALHSCRITGANQSDKRRGDSRAEARVRVDGAVFAEELSSSLAMLP